MTNMMMTNVTSDESRQKAWRLCASLACAGNDNPYIGGPD